MLVLDPEKIPYHVGTIDLDEVLSLAVLTTI